jgi:hypothetical protein
MANDWEGVQSETQGAIQSRGAKIAMIVSLCVMVPFLAVYTFAF